MVIVFALLAALSNAVNEATQHIASTAAPRRSSGWRLVLYLFRNPLWLFGWVALAGAFVFQALALHNGQLSVVQPLLATELVFMLVLRRFWIHQSIRLITWGAAALTCVGLAVFIVAGQPGGGNPTATSQHWFTAGLACCAGAGVLAVLARRRSAQRSAFRSARLCGWRREGSRSQSSCSSDSVLVCQKRRPAAADRQDITNFDAQVLNLHWPQKPSSCAVIAVSASAAAAGPGGQGQDR